MDFVLELAKLIKSTPKLCLPCDSNENSQYNSFLYKSKDCYLCFASSFLQSCYYLDNSLTDVDCVDCDYARNCELCYECTDINKCYNCNFCRDCVNCVDCEHCYECHGCSNCFGCVGLQKKQFYIFNEKYSKEEYLAKLKEVKTMSADSIEKKLEALRLKFAHPALHVTSCENVVGDYLVNCKNCFMCFNGEKARDLVYGYDELLNLKDSVDCDHVCNGELMYNCVSADSCYNVNGSWWMMNCNNCEYGFCNRGCSDCFGCVNVSQRKYNILNKQYTKEEYVRMLAEIKEDLKKRSLYGKFLIADAVELSRTL